MKPKTSPIWKYFLEVDSCSAICIACEREYSRKGRTTSALKSHLKSLHPELFEEFQRIDDEMKNELFIKKNNAVSGHVVTKQIIKNIRILTKHKKVHDTSKTIDNRNEVNNGKSLLREKNNVVSTEDTSVIENNNEMSDSQIWTSEIKIEIPNEEVNDDLKYERETDDGNDSSYQENSTPEKKEGTPHDHDINIGHKRIWINEYVNDVSKRRKCVEVHNPLDTSNERSQEMDRLIGEMIAEQGLPFEFVESVGFRRVMNKALPAYKLNGAEYFTSYICEDLYFKMRNKMKNNLSTFDKITFAVDIVKLEYGESLLMVTAIGIDEEFHKKTMVLKCEVLGEYTEQEVSAKFQCTLQEWDIEYEQVNCVIRNQGCMEIEEVYINIDCVVHQIQRCVNNAMEKEEWFQKLMKKLMNINKHFKNSVSAQKELKSIQAEILNQSFIPPFLETSNRWNPWYSTMEQFLRIKDSLTAYIISKNITRISLEDWSNIETCVKLYKPIDEITKELANENNNVSSAIPLLHVLINAIEIGESTSDIPEHFKAISIKLSHELKSILNNLKNTTHYGIATYLDPRYKTVFFNDKEIGGVETAILNIIIKIEDNGECNAKKQDATEDQTRNETASQLQTMLESILSANDFEHQQTTDLKVKRMLENYKKEIRLKLKEDPLVWWKNNGSKYSLLLPLVRKFLQTPASTVCKQMDEAVSYVKSNRVQDKNSMKLLFLKCNLPLLNFDY